jgi:hypothetical protein
MYATCLFCHTRLGANEAIEQFPVGRRLAFDAARGRLWVVCGACGRWNLSPLEERWDAIETCERLFRATRVRVTTTHIGLARLAEGCELVRIGSPLRPEFAAWRYGTRFTRRRAQARTAVAAAGIAVVASGAAFAPLLAPALAMGALSIVVVPGLTTVMGVVPAVGALALRDYVLHDRVIGRLVRHNERFGVSRPRVFVVRAKHAASAQLRVEGEDAESVTLDVPHDGGWATFHGIEALQAAGVLLAGAAARRRDHVPACRVVAWRRPQRPAHLAAQRLARARDDAPVQHRVPGPRDGAARGKRASRPGRRARDPRGGLA